MDGCTGYYAKRSKSERDKCYIFTYSYNLKNKTTNKQKQIHQYRDKWLPEGWDMGAKEVKGSKRYKPPTIK